MGKAKLDPANPPTLSAATIARLDAMAPDQIERNAREDADNPPMTDAELDRMRSATEVRAIRQGRGMTQAAFAEAFGIAVARLRDWEQGRFKPDDQARFYLETIRRHPEAVEGTIAEVRGRATANREAPRVMTAHIEPNQGRADIVGLARHCGSNADQAEEELAKREVAVSGHAA